MRMGGHDLAPQLRAKWILIIEQIGKVLLLITFDFCGSQRFHVGLEESRPTWGRDAEEQPGTEDRLC